MTVVGLCGLQGSGQETIAYELVRNANFTILEIDDCGEGNGQANDPLSPLIELLDLDGEDGTTSIPIVRFSTVQEALDHVTSHWRENFVMPSLQDVRIASVFLSRPFFLLVAVQAPLMVRLREVQRQKTSGTDTTIFTLEELARQDDRLLYEAGLAQLLSKARLTIINKGDSVKELQKKVHQLGLGEERWIRPEWDSYFMHLAELASTRSNCMKRRVGAILVKDRRIVATGYNGTARGLDNCCDGGCPRCNGNARCGQALEHCLCLHAEENALLEAGRARSEGATIYCTTAPCLVCSRKIIQSGLARIVYAREYSLEHNSKMMLEKVGIMLEKFVHEEDF